MVWWHMLDPVFVDSGEINQDQKVPNDCNYNKWNVFVFGDLCAKTVRSFYWNKDFWQFFKWWITKHNFYLVLLWLNVLYKITAWRLYTYFIMFMNSFNLLPITCCGIIKWVNQKIKGKEIDCKINVINVKQALCSLRTRKCCRFCFQQRPFEHYPWASW